MKKQFKHVFSNLLSGLCTFTITGEEMMLQKFYWCATCNIPSADEYCICEICIKNCHAGHITYETPIFEEGFGPGFCDCGEEGSRGIRSCKMLKGKLVK